MTDYLHWKETAHGVWRLVSPDGMVIGTVVKGYDIYNAVGIGTFVDLASAQKAVEGKAASAQSVMRCRGA